MKATEKAKERMREWYRKNRDKHLAYHRKDWTLNKEKHLKRQKKYYKQNSSTLRAKASLYWQSPKGRFVNYISGAKERGLSFELTFEEFMLFWQQPCYYCNDPVKTIGLDRVDSSRGYVLTNVVACCETHNKGKSDLSQEEFIVACNKVARRHPRVTE